jgi:hypothetical protein
MYLADPQAGAAITSASLSLMARLKVLHGVRWTFPCGRRSSR